MDSALRRPGRFDRQIYIGIPNAIQRYKILKIHTNEWNINENENENFEKYLKHISYNKTIGFSGADLKALCNETFMNCIHRICHELMNNCDCDCNYNPQIANKLKNENVIINIHDFETTFQNGF
ncbi:MAG: hypothetical protein GY755_23480 [Chloroflexi bacterium]|nr:hypothetical protein [Chloroflexota bacterium]